MLQISTRPIYFPSNVDSEANRIFCYWFMAWYPLAEDRFLCSLCVITQVLEENMNKSGRAGWVTQVVNRSPL